MVALWQAEGQWTLVQKLRTKVEEARKWWSFAGSEEEAEETREAYEEVGFELDCAEFGLERMIQGLA